MISKWLCRFPFLSSDLLAALSSQQTELSECANTSSPSRLKVHGAAAAAAAVATAAAGPRSSDTSEQPAAATLPAAGGWPLCLYRGMVHPRVPGLFFMSDLVSLNLGSGLPPHGANVCTLRKHRPQLWVQVIMWCGMTGSRHVQARPAFTLTTYILSTLSQIQLVMTVRACINRCQICQAGLTVLCTRMPYIHGTPQCILTQ